MGGARPDGFNRAEQAQWLRDQHDINLHYKPKNIEADIRHSVYQTMQAAKENRIHPMYLLGNAPSSSTTAVSAFGGGGGTKGGRDYAAAGRGLAEISNAFGSRESRAVNQKMVELGLRQADAETRKSEYAAEIDYINLQRLRQEANSNQESAVTYAARPPTKQEKLQIADAKGIKRTVSMPNLSDTLNPHYGEGADVEAFEQWTKDRASPRLNEWAWRTFGIPLTELGRAVRAFKHSKKYRTGGKF